MYFMAIPSIKRPYESTSNEKYPLTPKLRCVCSLFRSNLRPDGTYGDGWDLRFAPTNYCRKLASLWVNHLQRVPFVYYFIRKFPFKSFENLGTF